MAEWNYGTAGDRYPVKRGEVWKAGEHQLFCGDLEDPAHREQIVQIASAVDISLVYTDPPWNSGNAAAFRTKAGVPATVDFPQLLDYIFSICMRLPQVEAICIEGGVAQRELVRARGEAAGLRWIATYDILYYRKHPCLLHLFTTTGKTIDLSLCAGRDDDHTPGLAIDAISTQLDFPASSVLDLCMGRGGTAVSAQRRGWGSVGMELHPRRLAVTIEKLSMFTNQISRIS